MSSFSVLAKGYMVKVLDVNLYQQVVKNLQVFFHDQDVYSIQFRDNPKSNTAYIFVYNLSSVINAAAEETHVIDTKKFTEDYDELVISNLQAAMAQNGVNASDIQISDFKYYDYHIIDDDDEEEMNTSGEEAQGDEDPDFVVEDEEEMNSDDDNEYEWEEEEDDEDEVMQNSRWKEKTLAL